MALSATIYNFTVELSDVDRGVYDTLELKLAQHPSESVENMLTRLLAYCLEYTDGIAFTEGVAAVDEPAVVVRDLTGRITAWVEAGLPDAERLHRASKAAERVIVYTHRDPRLLTSPLEGKKIHRREELIVYAVEPRLIEHIATRLERRSTLSLSITERHLYAEIAGATFESILRRIDI